jgi:hypothetical protein
MGGTNALSDASKPLAGTSVIRPAAVAAAARVSQPSDPRRGDCLIASAPVPGLASTCSVRQGPV